MEALRQDRPLRLREQSRSNRLSQRWPGRPGASSRWEDSREGVA